MEKRPDFDEIKTFEEFSRYYWYREELQQICRSHGIDASGMKAELNNNIKLYFDGTIIEPKKTKTRTARIKQDIPLTLETSLIECGFTFGPRFREFFIEQTGNPSFKFNVDMVASARKAKEINDKSFTLGNLLDIYYGRESYAKYDNVSLQWNKFVHDFCADPATANFPDKLKTAAALWKTVRESTREKVYTHELLKEYMENNNGI
ncbi:MAG: SAP domain-containing protein [Treponema sp.]|nr:SAP domain-containing protein [Treponema sp.]